MSMTRLNDIIARKRQHIAEVKAVVPLSTLERQIDDRKNRCFSLVVSQGAGVRIIAEFKKASPVRGVINGNIDVGTVAKDYEGAGAVALSILTERDFFMGQDTDLMQARRVASIPILRKDFVVDPYQIYESKVLGADAVLLIVAAVTPVQLRNFVRLCSEVGLEALVEVHTAQELSIALDCEVKMIGINNRNLLNLDLDLNTSRNLISQISERVIAISESGIESPTILAELYEIGFDAFLIGTHFMRSVHPGLALQNLKRETEKLISRGTQCSK